MPPGAWTRAWGKVWATRGIWVTKRELSGSSPAALTVAAGTLTGGLEPVALACLTTSSAEDVNLTNAPTASSLVRSLVPDTQPAPETTISPCPASHPGDGATSVPSYSPGAAFADFRLVLT